MGTSAQRSALGLIILVGLVEEPMHPYRIQALIKARGKDRVVNVRGRASIYQAIDRLQRLGLVRVRESGRVDRRPERTVYEITDEGRRTATRWLKEMLAEAGHEFPEFLVGVASLALLSPAEAQAQLEKRAAALQAALDELEDAVSVEVPRMFLLEEELRGVAVRAELDWVRSVIDDLRTGRLTWNDEWLREVAATFESGIDHGGTGS
ncbi:MAG: PadR family transcriptional regulator [Pseudonocardia sp.]